MAWYRTGTVDVTNGSSAVAGTATGWAALVRVGWGFVGPDGVTYEIASVDSDTGITLASDYLGATVAGVDYAIFPTSSADVEIATALQQLIDDYQATLDGAGQGKFENGTLAAPGMRFINDLNTGLRRAAADRLALVAGGVDQLTVDAASGLGGALVQDGKTDAGAGKVMLNGAHGLGASYPATLTDTEDPALVTGFSLIGGGTANRPGTLLGGLVTIAGYLDSLTQFAMDRNTGDAWVKATDSDGNVAQDWSMLFAQHNIVGTIAAGAAIETGSFGNGDYIRFRGGAQICWLNVLSTNSGSLKNWTFPAAFSSAPAVLGASRYLGNGRMIAGAPKTGSETTNAEFGSWLDASDDSVSPSISAFAFGFWN